MAKKPFNVSIKNETDTKKMFKQDFPNYARFAIANTASRVAFLGVEKAEDEMRKDFFLRNKFVVSTSPGKGAVKFNKAIPHHDISKIKSSWGSPEKAGSRDYSFLEEQEEGFTHEGMIPIAENARTSKSEKKPIKRAARRYQLEVMSNRGFPGDTEQAKTRVFLKEAFKNGFGLPGSKQYFYLKKGDLNKWSEGLYQFKSSAITKPGNRFPNVKQIYTNNKNDNRRRKAKHWMENSKNKITQSEIERIYFEEARRSFTHQITKMK